MAICALFVGGGNLAWAYQTPVADGVYYLYNTGVTSSSPGFICRGENYAQRAVIDKYGIPFKLISTGETDTYYFQLYDTDLWLSDDGYMYTDGDTDRRRAIKVELQSDGIYKLLNTNNNKEVENWYGYPVGDGTGNRRDYLWQFLSVAEYETVIAGYTATEKSSIATTMGWDLTGTTFDSYLSANYIGIDKTSLIQHATFDTGHNTDGWTVTANANSSMAIAWGNEGGDKITPEVYQGYGTISQTVTVENVGLYKVSVNAFVRNNNYERFHSAGAVSSVSYLKANDNKVRLCDIYSNGEVTSGFPGGPNAANTNFFSKGNYLNEVYVYVGDSKTITITLGNPSATAGCWMVFNNFKLTYYSDEVSDEVATAILSQATELESKAMLASVKSALTSAKTTFDGARTKANYDALNTAITNANTSISIYTTINDYLTFTQEKVSGDYSSITTAISDGDYSTLDEAKIAIKAVRNSIAYAAAADKENITQLIDNPGFELGNTNYWTVGSSDDTGARSTSNATYVMENSEGNYLFNTWSKGIPLTQSLGELPAGTYTLISTVASDGGTIYLLVNEDHSTSIATTDASKGLTLNKTFTLDAPTEVTIGVVGSAGDLSYTAEGHWWYKADNFRLIKGELILPTSISLNTPSVDLITGSKVTLTGTFTPNNTTDKSISWSSSDNTVATVSDGVVIAQGVGTATITARSSILGSVYTTATITVADAGIIASCSEVGEGDFFIRNVATGQYLGAGNDYGTRASIMKHGIPFGLTKVSDGVYTFDSYMYRDANNHFFRGDYCDQGATNIYVTDLGGGKYALSTEASNKYVTVNAGTTIVANTAGSSASSLAQWQFFTKNQLLENLTSSTAVNPGDATFYLNEADYTEHQRLSKDNSAWKGDFARGGNTNNRCAERYCNTTDVYQTVSVPNGTYIVKAQGFYRNESGDTPSYLYANGESVALNKILSGGINNMAQASTAFSNGEYQNQLEVVVTDNKLKVGIKCEVATNWTLWDNFELYLKTTTGLNVTPIITDGDYYLAASGKLISRRGGDGGEKNQAMAAETGLEATVTTDIAGISTITFKDTNLRLFWNEEKVYTDGTLHVQKNYHHPFWVIEEDGDFFKIRNIETGKYLTTATVSEELIADCAAEGADWLFTKNITISENTNYTPTAMGANVTLTRTLSNTNWNTFVVPFNIDNATLMAKFGTVQVAEYSETAVGDNSTVNFTKMATPAITANKPVLLKTSTAPASVTFNGVVIKTGDAKVAGSGNYDFVGSYNASTYVTTGNYYLSANKIYKSAKDDGTFIKGTRAYIEAKTTGARIVDFTIDGVTSGIRDLNADLSESEGVVYNLNGQKVQSVKNGVFVKNGKKVVVK